MTKIFSTSALCLGLFGAAVADTHAQNLFVANLGSNSVSGYDATGTLVGVFADNGINQPVGLAAYDGSLYVTSYDTGANISSILRLDNNGAITPTVVNNPGVNGSALQNPKAIAFGANINTLYVANGGNLPTVNNSYVGVANVTTGGYAQPNVGAGGGFGGSGSSLNAAYSLAYDGTRYLYAGNGALNDNRIVRFDTASPGDLGTVINLNPDANASLNGVNSIGLLNGLTIGPDGALYATDGVNRDVLRIATPTVNTSTFSIFVDGNGAIPATRLQGPEGLIFDPTGTFLYVSNDDNTIKRIAVIDVGGITTTASGVLPFVTEATNSGPGFLAFSPIPEPSTYALFGVAGATMLVFCLKRRQQLTLRA